MEDDECSGMFSFLLIDEEFLWISESQYRNEVHLCETLDFFLDVIQLSVESCFPETSVCPAPFNVC